MAFLGAVLFNASKTEIELTPLLWSSKRRFFFSARQIFHRAAISSFWFIIFAVSEIYSFNILTVTEISPQTAASTLWNLLKAKGSKSIWMVGFLGVIPVWFEKEAPITKSRSDSFINQDATGVPLLPSTPQPREWLSDIWPFPLKVVITGQLIFSAKAIISSIWKHAPCPTIITGLLDLFSIFNAFSKDVFGGEIVIGVSLPSEVWALTSSATAIVWISSGKVKWDTSLFRIACFTAKAINSACWLFSSTRWLNSATVLKALTRSTSWKLPVPTTWVATWPVKAKIGARSTFASQRPVNRLVEPGPAMAKHAAGFPVSLP